MSSRRKHRHTWRKGSRHGLGQFVCTDWRCKEHTFACDECGSPMNRAPRLDKPFDKDTFGGEGVWEGYRCKNGHVYHEPID